MTEIDGPSPDAGAASTPEPTAPAPTAPGTPPDWEKRFRAPRVGLPQWAEDAPSRSLFVSNVTGTFELYAWDRETDERRQVTDRPNGTTHGTVSPDGAWIWWFSDTDGDEFGTWVKQPFHPVAGSPDQPAADGSPDQPAVPGLAAGYSAGLALGRDGLTVVGRSTDEEGSTVHVLRPAGESPGGPVEIYRHPQSAGVGDLSRDGALIAIEHTEHGDAMHSALRVVHLDGSGVAELDDTKGGRMELGLTVLGFSPVAGDQRLLVGHQRNGRWEPMVWDPTTGEETVLTWDLPGDITAEWCPDGTELLVSHSHRARGELWRYRLADAALVRVDTPTGTVSAATARPDGTVEYLWSSAATPPQVRSSAGHVVLEPSTVIAPPASAGPTGGGTSPVVLRAPESVPVTDAWVEGPGGTVHALVQRPAGAGDGPFPTVFDIHGGPTWHDSDAFAAGPAAWVDHGFAVVRVNYRGSTGYGREWTDALKHRVGLIELEDIAAVRRWAVDSGLADPRRMVLAGGSWGGYLTLLGLGTQPDDWAVGLAAVPVADYVTAYHDEMDALKALDRTLLGGSPEEVPERFEASSPISYVDAVRAPVHISAGLNDPRCPIRQIENYVRRLADRGAPHEVYRYEAGHGSLVVEERIRQMKQEIRFVQRHLPA